MKIPSLGPLVRGLGEDKMLCLVGTLKIHRARTNSIRKQNPQMRRLFISNMKGFSKDICKNTLAGWIRSLIKLPFEKCPHLIQLSAAKPPEVRVMSASLAWRANIGLPKYPFSSMLIQLYNLYVLLFEGPFHHQGLTPFILDLWLAQKVVSLQMVYLFSLLSLALCLYSTLSENCLQV